MHAYDFSKIGYFGCIILKCGTKFSRFLLNKDFLFQVKTLQMLFQLCKCFNKTCKLKVLCRELRSVILILIIFFVCLSLVTDNIQANEIYGWLLASAGRDAYEYTKGRILHVFAHTGVEHLYRVSPNPNQNYWN